MRWAVAGLAGAMFLACAPAAAAMHAIDLADADAAGQDDLADPPSGTGSSGWEFSVSPYLWLSGLSGDVGTFPALQPVDVDLSFGDIWDNLDFAGMAMLQARNGRFVALADISYIDLSTSKDLEIREPGLIAASLDTSTFSATAAAGYRAVDEGPLFLDIYAGLRVTSVDARVELGGPAVRLFAENSETWVDPVIASRFRAPLGEKWAFMLYGDIGGFGVGSDLTWQLLGTVQYRIGRRIWLAGGWRHYAIDYEEDGFVYDVAMSGPIIGVTFGF